jgi:hypothetical protein
VFLKDGTSLVSYGELARVGDRVVFSMPTTGSTSDPQLHLVNLAADNVDWDRTSRYADAARANQYLTNQAAYDYALLSNDVAQALYDVTETKDPDKRVAIIEKAKTALAAWPASHFNYRLAEVRQMLDMLDEAIADIRAAAGADRFNLNFVSPSTVVAPSEPLLPPPTPKEAIEQVLLAARLAEIPAERTTLLTIVLRGLERDANALPPEWSISTGNAVKAEMAREVEADRSYRLLTTRMLNLAKARTKVADVRGLQRLVDETRARDVALGKRRPESVAAILASLEAELDVARRLQLARDQWALRAEAYRSYRNSMSVSMTRFGRLERFLEDIKLLAGSSPGALATIQRVTGQLQESISAIAPPAELRAVHSLFLSAASLAQNAATIRGEAALAGDIARAWDASAAAAGSLLLTARARTDMVALIQFPQLPQ